MPKAQEEMPLKGEGVERKTIKPLEEAIETWTEIKTKRIALTEKEIASKEAVRLLMEKHEVERYRFDDEHEVVLLDSVKMRKIESEGDDE